MVIDITFINIYFFLRLLNKFPFLYIKLYIFNLVRSPMQLKQIDTWLYRKVAESIFQDSLSPSPSCSYYDMLILFYRRQAHRNTI